MNQAEKRRQQIEIGSYLMGLINILIFGKLLGDEGIAFILLAAESFFLVRTLTVGSLTNTLGKLLRSRNQRGQYINANHIRKQVFILQGSLGLVCGVVFAFCAGLLANKVLGVTYCTIPILLMAPLICLRNLSAVLIGFFRGEGTELPGAVTAPLRQILLLGFGILFGRMLKEYGVKVANLLGDSSYISMYGSVGIALAMVLTEVLIVLFLSLITLGNRKNRLLREDRGMKQKESFMDIVRILYGSMGLSTLMQIAGLFPLWAGVLIFRKSVAEVSVFAEHYGVFIGKYLSVCTIPVMMTSLLLVGAKFRTLDAFRREDYREAKRFFRGGMHGGMAHGIFWTVFVAVMAQELVACMGVTNVELAVKMLRFGSASVLLGTLFLYFIGQLLGVKKKYHALCSLIVSDMVFVVAYFILANKGMGVLALMYGSLAALGIGCILTGCFCCRMLHCGIDWLHFIAIPAGAACIIGLVSLLIGKLLVPVLGAAITLLICFVVSLILYWVILVLFRCFDEQDDGYIPTGMPIRFLNRLFGIF